MKVKFKNISVVCLLIIVLSGFIFASCKPNNADYSELILETYVPANVSIIEEDKYGNPAIKVNENRCFSLDIERFVYIVYQDWFGFSRFLLRVNRLR